MTRRPHICPGHHAVGSCEGAVKNDSSLSIDIRTPYEISQEHSNGSHLLQHQSRLDAEAPGKTWMLWTQCFLFDSDSSYAQRFRLVVLALRREGGNRMGVCSSSETQPRPVVEQRVEPPQEYSSKVTPTPCPKDNSQNSLTALTCSSNNTAQSPRYVATSG